MPFQYWDHYAKLITAGLFKTSPFSLTHCVSVYLSMSSESQNRSSFVDMTAIMTKPLRHAKNVYKRLNNTHKPSVMYNIVYAEMVMYMQIYMYVIQGLHKHTKHRAI